MEKEELLLNLAATIKRLRKEKGVSQEEVYEDTKIHVARLEQGKRDPSFTTLIRLAEYFEVDLGCFTKDN